MTRSVYITIKLGVGYDTRSMPRVFITINLGVGLRHQIYDKGGIEITIKLGVGLRHQIYDEEGINHNQTGSGVTAPDLWRGGYKSRGGYINLNQPGRGINHDQTGRGLRHQIKDEEGINRDQTGSELRHQIYDEERYKSRSNWVGVTAPDLWRAGYKSRSNWEGVTAPDLWRAGYKSRPNWERLRCQIDDEEGINHDQTGRGLRHQIYEEQGINHDQTGSELRHQIYDEEGINHDQTGRGLRHQIYDEEGINHDQTGRGLRHQNYDEEGINHDQTGSGVTAPDLWRGGYKSQSNWEWCYGTRSMTRKGINHDQTGSELRHQIYDEERYKSRPNWEWGYATRSMTRKSINHDQTSDGVTPPDIWRRGYSSQSIWEGVTTPDMTRRVYITIKLRMGLPLQWCHNDHDSVSNHQPRGCLLNRLFRRRSKKTSKLRVTGLCAGNSPGPVNSPHRGPVTLKIFPFDDVIMDTRYMTKKVFITIKLGGCYGTRSMTKRVFITIKLRMGLRHHIHDKEAIDHNQPGRVTTPDLWQGGHQSQSNWEGVTAPDICPGGYPSQPNWEWGYDTRYMPRRVSITTKLGVELRHQIYAQEGIHHNQTGSGVTTPDICPGGYPSQPNWEWSYDTRYMPRRVSITTKLGVGLRHQIYAQEGIHHNQTGSGVTTPDICPGGYPSQPNWEWSYDTRYMPRRVSITTKLGVGLRHQIYAQEGIHHNQTGSGVTTPDICPGGYPSQPNWEWGYDTRYMPRRVSITTKLGVGLRHQIYAQEGIHHNQTGSGVTIPDLWRVGYVSHNQPGRGLRHHFLPFFFLQSKKFRNIIYLYIHIWMV